MVVGFQEVPSPILQTRDNVLGKQPRREDCFLPIASRQKQMIMFVNDSEIAGDGIDRDYASIDQVTGKSISSLVDGLEEVYDLFTF